MEAVNSVIQVSEIPPPRPVKIKHDQDREVELLSSKTSVQYKKVFNISDIKSHRHTVTYTITTYPLEIST